MSALLLLYPTRVTLTFFQIFERDKLLPALGEMTLAISLLPLSFLSELVLCPRWAVGAGNEGLDTAQGPGTSWCLWQGCAPLSLPYPICPGKEEKSISAAGVGPPLPRDEGCAERP